MDDSTGKTRWEGFWPPGASDSLTVHCGHPVHGSVHERLSSAASDDSTDTHDVSVSGP